ncbi:MAG TPA: hypothetical protein VFK10_15210 [Burkholderiaceae bacterium]|nr:hypothetical protein [Burkholderiaceae bacterium]
MGDVLNLLLALAAVLAPLGLAWWLLRERPPPGTKALRRRRDDDRASTR